MKPLTLDELTARLPKTLDDVIPRKDVVTLRLATRQDLAALPAGVCQASRPKMALRDWHVIAILETTTGEVLNMTLFGTHEKKGGTYCSSNLVAHEGNRFLTHSGAIYEVVGETSNTPDLWFVCGWLNQMGVGEALGVLAIFF